MKVHELVAILNNCRQEDEIMIKDSTSPREINLGPVIHTITEEDINNSDDCERFDVDETVYVIGFGNY